MSTRVLVMRRSLVPAAAVRLLAVGSFPARLNEQIGREFGASQQYVAIAVYYDAETLPNLAAHFYRQAVEERNHAMMIVQYLLDADEEIAIPGVEAPRTEFPDPVAPRPRARAGACRHRPDRHARPARARGERPRRRAVPALVPRGAARGGVEHVVAPPDRGAGRRQPPPGRAVPGERR